MSKEKLPIDAILSEIISKIKISTNLLINASPGAGKTTRVAAALLDAGLAKLANGRDGQIFLLEPRRVAAKAAAAYMSLERNKILGEEIGYIVKQESKISPNSSIIVCTEGVFLRKIQSDPTLENTAIVIFDEFHERNLDSDLALALVKQVQKEIRPDLRIIVMSATIDSISISKYLNNCPIIFSEGLAHPVEIFYSPQDLKKSIAENVALNIKNNIDKEEGHILAFLPGYGEIKQAKYLLEQIFQNKELSLYELYGEMSLVQQLEVLSNKNKKRKIILSTNIAETSLTIDGVRIVIDSGWARINKFDPRLGLNKLELTRISQASAKQRAGRAGRTKSGTCIRLWSEKEQQMLTPFTTSEITRVDLSAAVLQLLSWGEKNINLFDWLESPSNTSIKYAFDLLTRLDAYKNGYLTELGHIMSKLPLQPRIARLLLESKNFSCAKKGAICAALLTEKDPIINNRDFDKAAKYSSQSDVLDRLWAIEEFQSKNLTSTPIGNLDKRLAETIIKSSQNLLKIISADTSTEVQTNPLENTQSFSSDEAILKSLLVAFPDRVCKLREINNKKALMVGGKGIILAESSVLTNSELFVAVELSDKGKQDIIVHKASAIKKDWLPESQIQSKIQISFDKTKEKVCALKQTFFIDLVLDEQQIEIPSDKEAGELLTEEINNNLSILDKLLSMSDKDYLNKISWLNKFSQELNLPEVNNLIWQQIISDWCQGKSSFEDLRKSSIISFIKMQFSFEQITKIDNYAPDYFTVPSGSKIKIDYSAAEPVLAVRIQEMFGLTETPKILDGKHPLLLHLLAPNFRIQQITFDLKNFWKNTYPEIRKELKARYPKHSWPDDPINAEALRVSKNSKTREKDS